MQITCKRQPQALDARDTPHIPLNAPLLNIHKTLPEFLREYSWPTRRGHHHFQHLGFRASFRTGASALLADVYIRDDDGHGADVENLPERDHGQGRNELRQFQHKFDRADAHGSAQPRERGDEIVAGMESEH